MTMTTDQQNQPTATLVRRWDPFRDLEDVYERVGQLMNGLVADPARAGATGRMLGTPLADLEETEDAYLIDVDLPSVRKEDLNLELRDNDLRISGEYKERERKGMLRRRNRRVGQFEYMVALPGDVDPDNVEANLHDGVLTVRVGKSAGGRARHIEVKGS